MEGSVMSARINDRNASEFFHHLRDTLILLGADVELADRLESPEPLDASDVDKVRRFNGELVEALKTKLVNISKIAVEVAR
jgi:hypothetical protein